MRSLVPVDIVSEQLSPPEGAFWTTPEMYSERTGEPGFTINEVARLFFGRSRQWLRKHVWYGHLLIDGEEVIIPREADTGYLRWRLYDIERTALALTQSGYLQIGQLERVIGIVKLVAQNYNYLLPSQLETRVIPSSKRVRRRARPMAVETLTVVRDDLDDSSGATTRRFSVEDVHYRIDLTDKNWEQLLSVLQPYIAVAQPDKRRRIATPEEVSKRADIREWAKKRGYQVGERGRIPYTIVDEYNSAHRKKN